MKSIKYSCGFYHDFRDIGLLLTRMLLNQEFLVVKLKSKLQKTYDRHHDLINQCRIFAPLYLPISVLYVTILIPPFMIVHELFNKSNTTSANIGARTS
jgi:hypothetical protein